MENSTAKRTAPRNSPWGKVDHYKTLCGGVHSVMTESHGGIMMTVDKAEKLLSLEALKCGFIENGYACFEEDCAASVAFRELMDRGLYKAPVNEYWKPGQFEQVIDRSIKQWHPDYWTARESGKTKEPAGENGVWKSRLWTSLPKLCFAIHPEGREIVIIEKGVPGVSLSGIRSTEETIRECVDKLNETICVTSGQETIMLECALHGWDKVDIIAENLKRSGKHGRIV